MPVVPIEENKVGIASLTDARLRPGNFSGSGLDALGSGLQQLGGAGEELGKALGKIPAKKKQLEKTPGETAAGQVPAANKQSEAIQKPLDKEEAPHDAVKPLAERAPKQTPKQAADDAAVKRAYNDYAEVTRPHLYGGNGAMAEQQGGDALAAAQPKAEQVLKARDDAAASLSPDLHEAFHAAIAPRVTQDLHFVQSQAAAAALVAQQQQSQRVVNNSAEDAVLQYGSPAFAQSMATGLRQIDEQATTGGWTPEAKRTAETGFISRVHRGVSDAQSMSDPVLAAEHLRVFGDHMTPEDRAAAWRSLQGPLTQTQAVADLDTLAIARSATAPLTPHGDGDRLMQRMLAITPAGSGADENASGANAAINLPALLDRYGGDAAKAWAASKIGADALDALVAKQGASWFAALPAEARTAVAANMAMLNAVSSQRSAPAPAERGELAMAIADQPWSDERKQHAFDELNTRIALEARRDKEAQDDAKEKGLGVAEQLGAGFISINQLPPAVREHLAPDALAALTLRADRNVHRVTAPAHGDVAMGLNRMAASDPEAFAKEDLRLRRDEMTAAEYEVLGRLQKGIGTYPPAPAAMTQRRALETMQRNGLDVGPRDADVTNQPAAIEGAAPPDPAPEQSAQTEEEVDRLANVETIPEALRGADTTKAAVREMLGNGWTPDQIQNQLYDAYIRRALVQNSRSTDQHADLEGGSGQEEAPAQEDHPGAEDNATGAEQTAQLIPIGYGKAKQRTPKAKQPSGADALPDWARRRNLSVWRSPIYLSTSQDSEDKDIYDGLKRMGNPDDLTIIFSHGAPASGRTTDKSRGQDPVTRSDLREIDAEYIYVNLRQKNFVQGTPILLTSCFGANDDTARQLSAMTGGVVYVAKAYVLAPSAKNHLYDLSVYTRGPRAGKRTGYAKFYNGKEVPSELLSLKYNEDTHQWSRDIRTPPAPVGDRVRPPQGGLVESLRDLIGW